MTNLYNEDNLAEQPAIKLIKKLWGEDCHINAFSTEGDILLGRNNNSEVVLTKYLRPIIGKLNPGISESSITNAVDIFTADKSLKNPIDANKEVYEMLRNGIKIQEQDPHTGKFDFKTIKIIDWNNPENNHFMIVSQMRISGELYNRRPDVIAFVNGIPLLLIELKAPNKSLFDAFNDNIRDYKDTIPQIFWYNAAIIISNGLDNRIGTMSSGFEHFAQWKKIESEDEQPKKNLETMIHGVCEKTRLLDLVENFVLFDSSKGKLVKIIAKYHQYIGVNKSIENFKNRKQNLGKIGVFWHTQGSGKSFSMMFFTGKILRKLTGNFTFVIVTDRDELDKQIYKGFLDTELTTEKNVRADSIQDLRDLLQQDHRFIFTLIHKFQFRDHETPRTINERDDIIVITDEAHRSQYGDFSMNMRVALPNASFMGFTGTPLIAEEKERTKEVFGDYVSIYNFSQSVEDGATVPIYYENRVPKLENTNSNLQNDLEAIIEKYEFDENAEEKLESEFSTTYHILTREDRLQSVAEDIVNHYMGRGNGGKAMVVSIDKKTTVKMYLKVAECFEKYKDILRSKLQRTPIQSERDKIQLQIEEIEMLDMAVVISLGSNQNEIDDFKKIGIDFRPFRKRLLEEDLETKFKDIESNLKIVFVCSMWLTGFDVPNMSTLYLDKPMKNHTLMQTIARTNRVFAGKTNGLIVDYIGIFQNLKDALAIYASTENSITGKIIENKNEMVSNLRSGIGEINIFLSKIGIDLEIITRSEKGEEILESIDTFVDILLQKEEYKKEFTRMASNIKALYKAILPDTQAIDFQKIVKTIEFLSEALRQAGIENIDLSDVKKELEELLDRSLESEKFQIKEQFNYKDLSKLPFDTLNDYFKTNKKQIIVENLKNAIEEKISEMIQKNKSRMRFMEKFNRILDEYNLGSKNIDEVFNELIELAKLINEEDKRAFQEGLTEDELTIFDLLCKEGLTGDEEKQIKKVASELLQKIKDSLVIDWRKYEDRRTKVEVSIEDFLFYNLPRSYDTGLTRLKAHQVYLHVYEHKELEKELVSAH